MMLDTMLEMLVLRFLGILDNATVRIINGCDSLIVALYELHQHCQLLLDRTEAEPLGSTAQERAAVEEAMIRLEEDLKEQQLRDEVLGGWKTPSI